MVRFAVVLILFAVRLAGADHRVDCAGGGTFKTLDEVNSASLAPGDTVLFKSGCRWSGQLKAQPGVSYGRFGRGAMPRIDAEGKYEDAVLIRNASGASVRSLEITNRGEGDAVRRGVHIVADNTGVMSNVTAASLYIHDVNGANTKKDNGGIIFRTNGNQTASRFEGLTIERNLIWKVDRSAIAGVSFHYPRTRWNPSLRVVIRDNHVEDIGGDGIVPWATDGALVEHNIAKDCNRRANAYNAGIWPWSTDNTVMRLNRASFTRTTMDGQGFDSDYNSRNTVIEYNLSHDNEGGFLLICTPGKRDQRENLGNLGTVARYNISRNDRARIFHVSAAEQTQVYGNAIYVGAGLDVQLILLADWNGWPKGIEFRDNLFHSQGTARYGHEISRAKDGTYGLGPGWGPSEGVVFSGNRYDGNHQDKPGDAGAAAKAPQPLKDSDWNWPGPRLDPAKPMAFESYIAKHRAWMIRLMEKQFGKLPAW